MDKLQELIRLHRMNWSGRRVARTLQISPNTERKYRQLFAQAGLLEGAAEDLPSLEQLYALCPPKTPPPQEFSSVRPWQERIHTLSAAGNGPTAIHQVLIEEDSDYTGSLSAVKRQVNQWRREQGASPETVVIPVETRAGEIAQVDFGYAGLLRDPKTSQLRRAWTFVMVLGYSRHLFAKIVLDQTTATWLQLHVDAFSFFGGVPQVVVPDNLKAAILRSAFGADDEVVENRAYRELAQHYGFVIDPTPPVSPEKKGKVERSVQYITRAFLKPREFADLPEANQRLLVWVMDVAGKRRHGTTGVPPLERFEVEKSCLRPLPTPAYEEVVWRKRTVQRDCCVRFEEQRWSVPFAYVGQSALLRATPHQVEIYVEERRVATHARHAATELHLKEEHLPEGRRELRHRDRAYWEARADTLDPEEVGVFIRFVLDRDPLQRPLRRVNTLLRLLEAVPLDRAKAACKQALSYGAYRAESLRRILSQGQPALPVSSSPVSTALETPRFARTADAFRASLEVTHGSAR